MTEISFSLIFNFNDSNLLAKSIMLVAVRADFKPYPKLNINQSLCLLTTHRMLR